MTIKNCWLRGCPQTTNKFVLIDQTDWQMKLWGIWGSTFSTHFVSQFYSSIYLDLGHLFDCKECMSKSKMILGHPNLNQVQKRIFTPELYFFEPCPQQFGFAHLDPRSNVKYQSSPIIDLFLVERRQVLKRFTTWLNTFVCSPFTARQLYWIDLLKGMSLIPTYVKSKPITLTALPTYLPTNSIHSTRQKTCSLKHQIKSQNPDKIVKSIGI